MQIPAATELSGNEKQLSPTRKVSKPRRIGLAVMAAAKTRAATRGQQAAVALAHNY